MRELYEYLTLLGLPLEINCSEDATAINGRVQYNSVSDEVAGFPLPLDINGMPKAASFPATSASKIESYFHDMRTKKGKQPAHLLNVVMAQSLVKEVAPFCLLAYCTDGKYTAQHVRNRWKYITEECSKWNIRVNAWSADGDPRHNCVMKNSIQLGEIVPGYPEWFNARMGEELGVFPFQDPCHIGTKFRNILLKRKLKFGSHTVSIEHLIKLLRAFSKETHQLTEAIIKPTDHMDFDSVLKICSRKTIELLEDHIEQTEGTVMYLGILDRVLRAFLDMTLTPLERVRNIWFSIFLLRIWRHTIMNTRGSTLRKHFITPNAYECVEINAHTMVLYMLFLKDNKLDHLFNPLTLGSQQCESLFRKIRSFSPTFSTVTNASVLEMLQKISRIELLNDISYTKLPKFDFPRVGKPSTSYYSTTDRNCRSATIHKMPSRDEIFKVICAAKLEAQDYAAFLNVSVPSNVECQLVFKRMKEASINAATECFGNTTEITEDEELLKLFINMNLSTYSKTLSPEQFDANRTYVKVRSNEQILCVLKRDLVWVLSKTTPKISSDRLRRVMNRHQ